MKALLVRHPPLDIAPGICYGRRLDIHLSPEGEEMAVRIAADPIFAGIGQIRTSPARRCLEVAGRIATAIGAPPAADPRLHELDFGEWEGKTWDEIGRAALDAWAAAPTTFRPPGGETAVELFDRVQAFHDGIVRDGRNCIVVSHGGPLKILAALLRGQPVDWMGQTHAMGFVLEIETKAPALPAGTRLAERGR